MGILRGFKMLDVAPVEVEVWEVEKVGAWLRG